MEGEKGRKQNDMLIDFRKLFPKYGIKPTGVLHVGANVGEEAPVYNELGIKKVIWIEGNPNLIPKLKDNVRSYGHRVFNFCAGDEQKMSTLHISNNAGQSSSLLELGTHAIAHPDVHYVSDVEVPVYRIDDFFDNNTVLEEAETIVNCDFLNIDVQGYELQVLKGIGDKLRDFKYAYLEVNKAELYKGCALVEDIDMYLIGYGFKRVETLWCGNTNWGDALYIKK